MKRKITILLILVSFVISAQKSTYELDPVHTNRKLKNFKKTPFLYAVSYRKVNFNSGGGERKIINRDYVRLEKEIEELKEKQYTNEEIMINDQLHKKEEIESIPNLIKRFLESGEAYDDKKNLLKEAQNLAIKYNVAETIYADEALNVKDHAKFKLLALNKFDLKIHLKKILWKLDELNVSKPELEAGKTIDEVSPIALELELLEGKLLETNKYVTIKLKAKSTNRQALLLSREIPSANKLQGEFWPLGVFYIIKKDFKNRYKKGEIISSKVVRDEALKDLNIVGSPKLLFKNKISKATFISEVNFLKNFAFMVNGKFNKLDIHNSSKKKRVVSR